MDVRHAIRIEVGTHGDKVGFTLHYAEGPAQHVLFAPKLARAMVTALTKVIDDIEYIERQLPQTPFNDPVRLRDSSRVELTPAPPTLGVSGSDNAGVDA